MTRSVRAEAQVRRAPGTACGAQSPTTRDDRGAHGIVADPELHADLDQGEAVGIQAGCLFTNRLRQRRHTGFEPGTPRDLADGAAMDLKAGGKLSTGTPSAYAASGSARFEALKRV